MKIERKKISGQVLEHIKSMLLSQQIPPNDPLPSENDFAKMFGVSRAPVREALSVLQASGIIETRQGGRTYVKEVDLRSMLDQLKMEYISMEQIFELLEMRLIMETQAAALAASRRDHQDLARMKEALDQFQMTLTYPDEVGDQADVNFHKFMIEATKNRFMMQVMENIEAMYRKAVSYSLQKNIGRMETRERVFQEHQNIFRAIEEQNEEKAVDSVKEHLQNVIKKLKEGRYDN
ncbi:FadR/GntR family transcriptional regulator [Cytobacillus purgationiresistens]|uniref:GntR family transcriptional repressor for pyruvate dehydrogenase complex n=1 Tax=Cytobacillus purgationiresistens TaxID=863449 RepID=A0ABU0AK87_9BACI|nr:FadR/GntR family transcriptional regulator [Cytobacillus purgationiresistens]MDQ0271455.1 GntR family transcriptional repressor for pyruvate dehydrogenase complex [Cytobacillus purgationiresistens]